MMVSEQQDLFTSEHYIQLNQGVGSHGNRSTKTWYSPSFYCIGTAVWDWKGYSAGERKKKKKSDQHNTKILAPWDKKPREKAKWTAEQAIKTSERGICWPINANRHKNIFLSNCSSNFQLNYVLLNFVCSVLIMII